MIISSFYLLSSFVGTVAQWNECADSSSEDYTDNYTRITVTHNKVGIKSTHHALHALY